MWLVAAGGGAVTQWAINQGLILAAFKLENPSASVRDELFSKETLHNDATELCAALLVAVGMTISDLTLIIALPLATLLQRSFRHAQLLSEARADAKTGLLNAATWEREAAAEVARAVRTSSPLAVALLDLDRFKQINDTYGHLLGDEVLRTIADTMTGVLREYDLAGRFGGEEFVMLLPQTRAPDAFRIAERVRAHIARLPIVTPGGEPVHGHGLDRGGGAGRRVEQGADGAAGRGGRRAVPGEGVGPGPGADDQHQPGAERGPPPVTIDPDAGWRPAGFRRHGALAVLADGTGSRRRRVATTSSAARVDAECAGDEFQGGRGHRQHRDHLGVRGVTLRRVPGPQHLRRRVRLAGPPVHRYRRAAAVAPRCRRFLIAAA